ncbi:trichohyalin-like isoform X4 [Penaeus indicus]|uniref:trichohyalin-like isoform X4 n=1 Tax=Penaeus indicus TaxID=29960 RepID=UPI00300D7C26
MTTAQVKKRQQNLGRLDVSQKDRTVIFDSSRFPRNGSDKDCEHRQEREAGKGDAQEEAKGAPKWAGRARSNGRNGVAWQQTARKGRRRKSVEGDGSQSEASTDSHAPGEESAGTQEGRRHFTKHSCVKVSKTETKRSGGGGPRGKYFAWANESNKGDSRGAGNKDENKVMPSPRIERMCRSPQLHKGRMFSSHRRDSSSSRTSPRQSPIGSRYQSPPGAVSPRLGSSSRVGSPRPDSPRIGSSRSASPRRMSPRVSPRTGLRSSPTKFVTSRTSPIPASPRIVKPIVTYGCQRSPRPTTFDRQRSLSVDKVRNGRAPEFLQKIKLNKENAKTAKDSSPPSTLLADSVEKRDSSRREEKSSDVERGEEKAVEEEEEEVMLKKDEKNSPCKGGEGTPEDGRQKIFPRPRERGAKGEENTQEEREEKTPDEEEEEKIEDDNSPDVPERKVKHPGRAVRETMKEGKVILLRTKDNLNNAEDDATTPGEETLGGIATGEGGEKKEKENEKEEKGDKAKGKDEKEKEKEKRDRESEDVEKDKENRNEKVKEKEKDKTNNNEVDGGKAKEANDLPMTGTPKPLKALRREMSDCRQRLESFVESRAMQEQRQQRYILITSKMSGKLDSEIIQFFESQQQKPREILRNEKVLHEHFRAGSKTDLRRASGSSFRSKSASTEGDKSSEDAKEGSEDDVTPDATHDVSFSRDITREAFPFLTKSAKESREEEGVEEDSGREHSSPGSEGKLEGQEKLEDQSKVTEKDENEERSLPVEEEAQERNIHLYDTVADDKSDDGSTALPSRDETCNHASITDHTGSVNTIPDDGNLRPGQGNDTIAGGENKEEEVEEEEATAGGELDEDMNRGETGKREGSVNEDDTNEDGGSDEKRGEILTEALSTTSLETAAFEEEERGILDDEKIDVETRVKICEETLISSRTDNVLVNESVREERRYEEGPAKVKKGIVKEIIMQKEEEAKSKIGETYKTQQVLRRDISPTAPKGKDETQQEDTGTKADTAPRKPDADDHPGVSPEGSTSNRDAAATNAAVGEGEDASVGSKESPARVRGFSSRGESSVNLVSQRTPLEPSAEVAEGKNEIKDAQAEGTVRSPLLRRTVQSKETRTVEFNFVKGKGLVREERVVFRGARDLQEDVSDEASVADKQTEASHPKEETKEDVERQDPEEQSTEEPDQNETLTAEDERHDDVTVSAEDRGKDVSVEVVVTKSETAYHEAVEVPHDTQTRESEEQVPEHMYANILPPPARVIGDEPREVTAPPREEEMDDERELYRTTTARRLMSGHRRLTKTISEGSFVAADEASGTERARPPSIRRSRTESEFLTDQLAAAATSSAEHKSAVSQIFTRGVSGKVRMKSRSVENIRLSSLSCVEITNPIDSAPLPKSSSACRIVGVLKKKDSRENVLELMSPSKDDEHEDEGEAEPQDDSETTKENGKEEKEEDQAEVLSDLRLSNNDNLPIEESPVEEAIPISLVENIEAEVLEPIEAEVIQPVEDVPEEFLGQQDDAKDHSESSSNQLAEEMSQLRVDNEKLLTRNRSLQREVEELRRVKTIMEEDVQLKPQINQMTMELTHAKEALSALKADRKRLKAEKFDLLNQMKQLYATLEDKEKELRDFIRNYEQRMKESDESLRQLAAERDETEREKWNILKHARDESERVVKLSAELGVKETTIRKLQEELDAQFSPLQLQVRKQLISMGYHSDAESVRTNGLPTPTASTPACSPLPLSTPTPTPNGRGSSADSGVRLSSDRDSTASHEGTPTITVERGSLDCDTLSICSSATAASHYYYALSLRGEDREDRGGDNTPTSVPTHSAASLNSSAMSGLASSNASTGGLSRSAEQLCERLAEAAESSKIRGCSTLTRKSHKGGGTWGSISRVFARQKKRAALDASLYDGSASDKRASWSPSSSLCASPLTEESYSEKLRLLEEAQHIPLERWKAPTVLAWLEVTLGMPQYGAMCAENIRSGKVLLELSDSELESGLGISHPMHRKKLRLAIEELREPRLTRFPRISALNHTWVSSEWLPDLGLPQYADAFANNLVDGRLLEALTKKELEKHLGVHRKFHQASIIHGVHLLRIVRFDRQVLAERRRQCEHVDCDPVVWTNVRWVRWARSVDLAEYADNLKDSGVHGALVVLESSFTADTMATALGIPQSKNIIRRHLATEMEALINPARQQIEEQARFAKMERRRQEKMAAGGSLGRSFSRSYGTGLEKGEKDKRRASLRGSLSRALGLRLREEAAAGNHNGGESSSSGGQSPAVSARTNTHHPHHTRPRSSVMPSAAYVHHETHRRVKSIGDIETITVTPV